MLISIDNIRVANLLFVERDELERKYEACNEIVGLTTSTIELQDSLKQKLSVKIENLNLIINSKDNIIELERDKLDAIIAEHRKQKFVMMGATGIIIALLIIL